MLSNLRHLVSFIAEIVSRKETRMLVDEAREVVSNISQHVASVQEMVEKCHLLNVKMNVALVSHQHLKTATPTVGQYGHKVAHCAFLMK